ncbi:hypothetical protein N7E02_20800 [Aliirhizobium terrae]|uniref:hypothetical protein n=1 Tax=Terrirhizobium terrae TaxID=2926709 RepID=UPI00257494A4|nr:hypothetical protein [Rhizobium sp. CC-CFT758]WJH39279.1 hypothetical protein N7E02_20800 [Rhizobium sp. CC-CFT758]
MTETSTFRDRCEPFGKVENIPYRDSFSPEEFQRIKAGFEPKAMEDKWMIYFEDGSLFLHRSWTGLGVYRVNFEESDGGARVRDAFCSRDVLQNREANYQAKMLDFLVSNLLLKKSKPFPLPENVSEPAPGVFQHHVAGTGYPQVIVRKRPWWKFWA